MFHHWIQEKNDYNPINCYGKDEKKIFPIIKMKIPSELCVIAEYSFKITFRYL